MTDFDNCTIIARPNPVKTDSVYAEVKSGQTLLQMLGPNPSESLSVTIGSYEVPRALWDKLRPKAGSHIYVHAYPQGGGGGSKWLRAVLMVVLIVVIVIFQQYELVPLLGTTGAAIVGAGLLMIGSLAINALVPPPSPAALSAPSPFDQLNSITGTSNRANPYGAIPCVVGTMRYFPPHAAMPYTEISGDDQYLRMLLDLGYGDLDVSNIQIGGTDIATYEDVQTEISVSPSLFSQDIYEMGVGVDMSNTGMTAQRTTQSGSTEISLDLVFSQGFFAIDTKGKTQAASTSFTINYRQTGTSSAWLAPSTGLTSTNGLVSGGGTTFNITSSAKKTLRCGIRWQVPVGQYDVNVTRGSSTWSGVTDPSAQSGSCAWSVLRSVSPQLPTTTGTLKLAIRIKASGQLNGVVQNLSVLASQKIARWDKNNQLFTGTSESQNPAWIYLWLLTTCPGIMRLLPTSRMSLDDLADWAAECDAKGLICSFVMDSQRALIDVLKDVLAAGRAAFGMTNGLYSAVRDIAQTVPVHLFTPANSSKFGFQRSFIQPPHALRVTFTNPEAAYQKDEILAYASGYTEANATLFETLDLPMVPDPIAAWKLGMYHLAVGWNRPNNYTLTTDIEGIVAERGDLVNVASDLTQWGDAWGRIVSVSGSTVELDGPVDLLPSTAYNIRVQRSDASQAVFTVTNASGLNQSTLTLSTAPLSTDAGTIFVLGDVVNTTMNLVVNTITVGENMSQVLGLVDYSTAVVNADTGTPPTFVSTINGTAWCSAPPIPNINIRVGTTTPNDAGSTEPTTGVHNGGGGGGIYRGINRRNAAYGVN